MCAMDDAVMQQDLGVGDGGDHATGREERGLFPREGTVRARKGEVGVCKAPLPSEL